MKRAGSPDSRPGGPKKTLAVLYLRNTSRSKEDAYFCDGVTEDIFTIQDEFARNIADSLRVLLTEAERRAIAHGEWWSGWMRNEPDLESLRGDPEFQALLGAHVSS